jgi:hypothetical protein
MGRTAGTGLFFTAIGYPTHSRFSNEWYRKALKFERPSGGCSRCIVYDKAELTALSFVQSPS